MPNSTSAGWSGHPSGDRVARVAEAVYQVTCRGVIDDGARARISLEFTPGGWTGGSLDSGQPFPSVPKRFHFKVAAASEQEAIDRVREIVEAAGGHVDGFEAELAAEN
jgi:hypothetical protein